ncbi:MAG: FAD-dependent oxidoreductase [Oscillospiraceae bacterium]|nr:FAD-dependent oxidoreductase [Oscillospiraceae bacterium]
MKNQKYPNLFKPIRVKNLLYHNRICSTPMGTVPLHVTVSSTDYGGVSLLDKARGGAGMVAMCYHGSIIDRTFETNGGNPFAKYEMDILRENLSVASAGGALVGFDIGFPWHYQGEIYTPSGMKLAERPAKLITEEVIEAQLQLAAEKAKKVKEFGFDLLILDISNDNVVGQFLAPRFNHRTDRWGGSLENRMRLAIELVNRVRQAVGPDFVIEFRVSAELKVEGSYTFDDMLELVGRVKDKIDILNIMVGMDEYHEANVIETPLIFEPHMGNVPYAKKVREKYPGLLIDLCTGIMTPEEGEYIIGSGIADFIMVGRSLNADPYWPKKAMEGRDEDIVPCLRCNQCYNTATRHFNTACSVNPRYRRENRVPLKLPKTDAPKKVVVVGAGPAGMKAALTADERGHEVILLEQAAQTGGLLNVADKGPYKIDLRRYTHYLRAQLAKSNVKVCLNTRADKALITSLKPDALIVAVGSKVKTPAIEGADGPNVLQAVEYLEKEPEIGQNVVVIGGGSVGCELALELSGAGKHVSVLEYTGALAPKGNVLYRVSLMQHVQKAENLDYFLHAACKKITPDSVIFETPEGEKELKADTVLLAAGMSARTDEAEALFGVVPQTFYVGDCRSVATIMEATNDAYFIAASI